MYGALLSARYYLVYLYNDEIYKEVKKYFLQKNIKKLQHTLIIKREAKAKLELGKT